MTCIEAEPHVSAVCDGEPISAEAAEHIGTCAACRATLADYAQIGTELRVAAAMDSKALPGLELPQRRRAFDFVWRRVPVPRFALAALIVAVVAAGVSVRFVSAQQRPLWFQFGYTLDPDGPISHYRVVKAGFDQTGGMMMAVNGALLSTALRIRVESVSNDDVVLRCRAVPGNTELTSDGSRQTGTMRAPDELPLNGAPAVHYRPGQQLAIPIEGGGAVYLSGDVYEQQPKIAFGIPLEPPPNQLSMRGPVLISEGRVLAEMSGGGATALPGHAVSVGAGNDGTFIFALKPFAGSVQGQIEWGQMTFTLDGRRFHLVAAGPLANGEQPRPVWVRHDPTPAQGGSIGTVRLGE
jgi:hypothetical protein